MSAFAADWLALRETADLRARDPGLMMRIGRLFHGRKSVRVMDLGAGTGSNMRALAPILPAGQIWTLVDADTALLEAVHAPAAIAFETLPHDLAVSLPDLDRSDLVTCAAFLDLVSENWCGMLADVLSAAGLPFYAALSYDGAARFAPAHDWDETMRRAVNAHQGGDKGFGPALGPDGAATLAGLLSARGYGVHVKRSPWRLGQADAPLTRAFLEGWAEAAADKGVETRDWLAFRRAAIDSGWIEIGHVDLLALPSSAAAASAARSHRA